MRKLLPILFLLLLIPAPVSSGTLTAEEWFSLYVKYMPKPLVAQRMQQLWGQVPSGTWKTSAKATLKSELLAKIAEQQALAAQYIDPIDQAATDVGDTDL